MRNWLIDKRNQLGITQTDLAKKLGHSQQYVSLIEKENRQNRITVDLLCKLAEILEMTVDEIMKYEKR